MDKVYLARLELEINTQRKVYDHTDSYKLSVKV